MVLYHGLFRREEIPCSRRVGMDEIEENDFNLNISRYVSTAQPEPQIDLKEIHQQLMDADSQAKLALEQHNAFLRELGLPPLPSL